MDDTRRRRTAAPHSGARLRWLVIGPFIVVVAMLAGLGVTSAEILSAVRAYVAGESLWSKGQKDAVYHLSNYGVSHRAADYQAFVDAIAVPLGDQKARLELERNDADATIARLGFIEGGNHVDDVDAMIWLFRNFRRVPFMADAIAIWAEADREIARLDELGRKMRLPMTDGDSAALAEQLGQINQRLTQLEQRFSATMGEASRTAQHLMQLATLVLALVLAAAAVALALGLLWRQSRAEEALRASEQRFRQLWESAPDAIVVFDAQLRIQFANPAVEELLGHAPGALLGVDVARLHPERLREAHRLALSECLRSGPSARRWRSAEGLALHRDGREIPVEVAFTHHADDGCHRFSCFLRDVSARREAEAAQRVSEERLRRALEASGLCLWDFDVESGSVYLSESWLQQLGGPPAATRTTFAELADLVPEAERQGVFDALVTALKDPRASYRVEHPVRKHDGTIFWNLSEGRVVQRATDGRALRMVGTNRDITERKQAEAIRLDLEAQLRESQKMEAIGTLAGGIAHDFNNILAAILGNLALARDEVGAGHGAQLSLGQISKSAMRARGLVQQILAFGRRQPHTRVTRPLRPLVEETLALMRSTVPAGVDLEVTLDAEPLHVLADATQMQQVLMNLCTNAWHALHGRSGRVVVGMAGVVLQDAGAPTPGGLPPGDYAHLWVADSGCGMDAATLTRIFEPFFTTKPVGQGTGLGLSVVHGIVAAHQGAISVDSTPGRGSTFHVYLPLVHSPQPWTPTDWGALQPLPREGRGQHVLYVDDDEVMVLLVERLLRRLGYSVTCHQDPRHAVEAVRAQPGEFDLVVSDFNMPGLSGLDVAREMARIRAALPVVISSGHITDEQRTDMLHAGVRHLIRKENTFEELGTTVRRLLQDVSKAAMPAPSYGE
jgi:PAS domain S-box-containing protein